MTDVPVGLCYGYGRVSTERQARNSLGPDAQEAEVRAYHQRALAPLGYGWGGFFFDPGVSASRVGFLRRPEGAALNAKLRRGDVVVFAEVSRGFRRIGDCFKVALDWRERGVRLVIANVPFPTGGGILDTNDLMAMNMLWFAAVAAHMERDMKSARTHAAIRESAAANRAGGYAFKHWYKVYRRQRERINEGYTAHLYPNLPFRTLMKWVFQQIERRQTLDAISAHLNAADVPRPTGNFGGRGRRAYWYKQRLHALVVLERKFRAAEQAAGADWEAGKYLMRNGEVWGLNDFMPAIQRLIVAERARMVGRHVMEIAKTCE